MGHEGVRRLALLQQRPALTLPAAERWPEMGLVS